MELRENQKLAVLAGINHFKEGNRNALIVAPTAYGKSIVIAHIAKNIHGKTLVLQPSKELLEQNYDKLISMGGEASIFSASMNKKEFGDITYATIGSIVNLGEVFKEKGYENLVIDECHLFPRDPFSMFGKFMRDSNITKSLGFTATPFRLQSYSTMMMGNFSKMVMLTQKSKNPIFFKDIIHLCQIKEMIESKYWCPLRYLLYDQDSGDLIFNSTGAEYSIESIEKFYKNQDIEGKIINCLGEIDKKHIIAFIPSVEQAIKLSKIVKNSGVVYSSMQKEERENVIRKFRSGDVRVVFNVNILSTGFNYPEVDCIIMGRPTASLAWLYQACGRGTRIFPGKEECLIVDFTGNITRFGKLEDLHYQYNDNKWKLYGSGNRLLTGVRIDEIIPMLSKEHSYKMPFGKHMGKYIEEIPENYLRWVMKEVKFRTDQEYLKDAILKRIHPEKIGSF